jgi:sRNA-binding regulator protein Hfq
LPQEVFAEEIEAFLERLESVSAARVVANDAGEIERIYATTESVRDDGAIRRAITSALLSKYNLHVDGWRVQIAHLEPQPESEPVPDCQLIRLEETMTETVMRVAVDLRYEHDGAVKTITGTAQAPAGQVHRIRTIAQATVEALRSLIERAGYRPMLEGVTITPFAGTNVVLAAVSLASAHSSLLRVGSECIVGSEAEAVVGAVLDAVRRPMRSLARPERRRSDRHQRFEGLRRHYHQMVRASVTTTSQGAPPLPDVPSVGESEVLSDIAHSPEDTEASAVPGEVGEPPSPPEASLSLAEIRPEREGGALPVTREDIRPESSTGPKPAPRPSMEDNFYRRLVATEAPVHIRCRDGYEIPAAVVRDFGTYSLLVETGGIQELVFKHGIIAIRPYGPLPPEHLPTA